MDVDQSPDTWKEVVRPLALPPLHEQLTLFPLVEQETDGLVGGPYGLTVVEVDDPCTDSPLTVLTA